MLQCVYRFITNNNEFDRLFLDSTGALQVDYSLNGLSSISESNHLRWYSQNAVFVDMDCTVMFLILANSKKSDGK
jgi:hypothetical protein